MSGWKAAWAMAMFGWRKEWLGMLFTFLFALYCGGMTGVSLNELLSDPAGSSGMFVMVDWMYLMVFPAFGLLMNRTAFKISRDDVYTKKIAHWRTMPIPLQTIVKARMLNALLMVPIIGLAFLLLQYGVSSALRDRMSLVGWLAAGFVWMCYAFAMNAVLIWLELGCSGKRYVWYYWGFVAACMIVSAILAFGGVHLVRETMIQIDAGHYYILPAGLAIAAAALYAGYRLTLKRMRERSYVF
ncbi:hypothetical protein [Cohnella candidum]|uniref:ABC transporter permease n=1 Tax=Cohnella candidum TaxID=2674991 RepID=A0A3G3K5S3_9BACL|nr:hypothetical protein [Cohnella candidum]AYQ75129.1 hypothetical protein EAV92_22820 [Cohnella candidum]